MARTNAGPLIRLERAELGSTVGGQFIAFAMMFRSSIGYNARMIPLIETKRAVLNDLCRRYGVRRLELFGSAATDRFDPDRSDLDFLVEFLPEQELGPWLRHYFSFQSELVQLFGRPIDLVLAAAAKNQYFQRELNRTRTVLYAA